MVLQELCMGKDSGWMDSPNYLSWFTKLFLPAVAHLTKTAPVFLIQDGHHSHISLELIRRARDNNIVILCLPSNTTHLLQPFGIAIFAPIKNEWKKILKQYKLETKGQKAWIGCDNEECGRWYHYWCAENQHHERNLHVIIARCILISSVYIYTCA